MIYKQASFDKDILWEDGWTISIAQQSGTQASLPDSSLFDDSADFTDWESMLRRLYLSKHYSINDQYSGLGTIQN
jgi:hypothetical protein